MNKLLKGINSDKYELINNAIIYTKNNDKYVLKEYKNNLSYIYNYLKTRNYTYIPNIVFYDDGYTYKYLNDYNIPNDKKMYDIIKITALLHSKTVYFKEVSLDYIKSIYEDILSKIDNTFKFYDNLIDKVETKEFTSPSAYLLLRNCTMIYSCLNFSKEKLESWYESVKNKNKIRVSVIHNNLNTDHIIEEEKPVLISWDNAKIDMPIYDFIKLYKRTYDKYDYISLFKEYNKIFSLTDDEKTLLFVNIFIPDIIDLNKSEFYETIKLTEIFNYLSVSNELFMKNQTKESKEENDNINKKDKSMESNT